MNTEIINKVKIKPIVNNITEEITDVKGKELFQNNLCNIFICARKKEREVIADWKYTEKDG